MFLVHSLSPSTDSIVTYVNVDGMRVGGHSEKIVEINKSVLCVLIP